MKYTTFLIAVVHLTYIICFMWLGPLLLFRGSCQNKYTLLIWCLFMIGQVVHWKGIKGECVLSYWEKKMEDPKYKLGSDPELTYAWVILEKLTGFDIKQIRKFHGKITQIIFIYAVSSLSLGCNIMKLSKPLNTLMFLILTYFVTTYISFDSFDMIGKTN